MANRYDVIIAGLGGMGSATTYQLALRGKRVLGLEHFTKAHNQGSSHGKSRVIRQAYFEDPAYVPLLLRAYELWEQIERETDQRLLTITGGLMIGRADSRVVAGSLRSAQAHGLYHELFDAADLRRRFHPLTPDDDTVALYETKAGFVHPEASVAAHLDRAAELGAELRFEEPIVDWEASGSGDRVRVTTERGSYEAARLVIAPGAWAPKLLRLDIPFEIERQVLFWFEPIGGVEPFLPDRFPIYIWAIDGAVSFYGFPAQNGPPGGVKVAYFHAGKQTCTPETVDRRVRPEEIQTMRDSIAQRIPALNGQFIDAVTCMYTNTPDQHFVIGLHPQHPQVVVASPCSGHGYKFASVIGEILADLATDGKTRHPIGLFDPERATR
jgi:sarcosine oxidase